jgi:hypothetical protein
MELWELYIAVGVYIGTTLSIILYFREAGNKLEARANEVFKNKKTIISNKYLETVEEIIERFKTTRTLSEELEDEFESISHARFRLNNCVYDLEDIVDKMTKSIAEGIGSVLSILLAGYAFSLPNEGLVTWFQLGLVILVTISVYRYVFDGFGRIAFLRKFEKLVNEVERSNTFNQLHEALEDE